MFKNKNFIFYFINADSTTWKYLRNIYKCVKVYSILKYKFGFFLIVYSILKNKCGFSWYLFDISKHVYELSNIFVIHVNLYFRTDTHSSWILFRGQTPLLACFCMLKSHVILLNRCRCPAHSSAHSVYSHQSGTCHLWKTTHK